MTIASQTAIPCRFKRGGASKGPFLKTGVVQPRGDRSSFRALMRRHT